ncbi:ABC transporter substrate-binding protein [Neokomagataea anthophila]|uniref:ABC transporter substrate-binding protein n=1 Tax=Neokomagataea anthophila TaxID=2826925 RepID=A0ABS5EA74_9PROT|nr:ABC transporter substrate-binding protein [Neokomagataea anthophila]MBR0560393.1 ABC transporter substrate-binding protein [Neokomagataea anthophila]
MNKLTIKRRELSCLLVAPFVLRKAWARGADPAKERVLRYQGWAGTVLAAELAEALGYLGALRLQWVGNTASGPVDLQAATTGDTEFASAFNGPIMKMIGAGAPVKAVYAYGGTAPHECSGIIVPEASSIRNPRDLIGRSVAINTLRAQQECFVDQYLVAAGLTAREIEQVTLVSVPPPLVEAALRHKRVDAAVLSTFFRDTALARGGLRELSTDIALYGSSNMDSVILRESYIREHPDDAAHFVQASARAIRWMQVTPRAEVTALMTRIIQSRKRGESILPTQFWQNASVITPGGYMTEQDFSRFQSWYGWRGDTRTASLNAKTLFTNAFNPYAEGA